VPKSGDRYTMPDGLGEYLVVRSHDETGGEYVEMEFTLPPDAFAPPPHIHPTQAEEYEVLEGSFDVMVDGEWRTLNEGEKASVPPAMNHTFRMSSDKPVRVRNFHRPGGRFDSFIEEQHRFVTSDRFKGLRRPSTAMTMAIAWDDHSDLLAPSSRPLRWGMAALARVGRLLGYPKT
jgi:quercetin dioxygenase-like cupin family protein